jgi:thioesterase domain-containing protein/acyl carrier protein
VTIGCPLPNYGIFILGPDLEPVPPGIAGEIYIAGLGLARAYHKRPALTAEKFVPHPFADSPGQRLYRSGDLGRWLPGGKVEFLGRADEQVKLRGYRIELGEIESVLLQQSGVGQAAVAIREDEPGEKKIIAYITPGKSVPDVTQIIAGLRAVLPEYMIPSAIMTLDTLPLSSNGKLDRKALPKPLRTARGISTSVQSYPRDNTETLVAQIWADVLGVDEVDIHANFFDLGGHSMSAVVVAAKLSNMYGRRISVARLFQSPTVEQFSSYLRQDVAREPAGTIVPIQLRGSLPPLFCVHPAGGLANAYVQLARQLGPDQPLYAFQAAGFEERHQGPTSIEAMAAAYISGLRAVAPAGPYRLLGWSLGGLIAYEMAQQLVSAGQTVSFLALLDSAAIVKSEPRPRSSTSRRNFAPAQERRLADRLALAQAAGKVPQDVSAEQYREFRELYARNVVAGRAYSPKLFLGSCPITLLSTHVETGNPTRGWGALSQGRVNVIEVPCHHEEMVFAPYVSLTATIIRDALDASNRE